MDGQMNGWMDGGGGGGGGGLGRQADIGTVNSLEKQTHI